ncbi:hypothetical protein F5883DRAFT_644133 [Diaporthe sp. PMI_573]|nr:hypothetical protein F5883DRAFT_644133 [Diaporthaceae sp. PMI_573]
MARVVTPGDVDKLRSLLGGTDAKVISPTDDGYERAIERWSKAVEKPAGVAIIPTDAAQMSTIVKFAASERLDLAVLVEPTSKTVKVGGGANWGEVDAGLAKHGLATVGGTISDTGVGGLTGKHGLTIDNLLAEDNPDLFWAVQGAEHNFGVVTEFVFQAYEQGDMFAGILALPPAPQIVEKVVAVVSDLFVGPKDGKGKTKLEGRGMGGLVLNCPPDAGVCVVLAVAAIFDGIEEEGKKAFKAFMKRAMFFLPLQSESVLEILGKYTKFTEENSDMAGSMIIYELKPLYHEHQG